MKSSFVTFLHFQLNYIQVNFNQLLILEAALNLIFYAYFC